MHRRSDKFIIICLASLFTIFVTADSSQLSPRAGLVWDSLLKEATPKSGEVNILYTFAVTNISTNTITIDRVDTSCGCTVVEMPSQPWKFLPGESGVLKVNFDARGKSGDLTKIILVYVSTGPTSLMIKAHLPVEQTGSRTKDERAANQLEAGKNRQAIFQGKCITCHLIPAIGKSGQQLYQAACGICHEAKNRATMVPDLKTLKNPTTKEYWEQITRNGKPNTLMPAFEQKQGGSLTEAQNQSLIEYLAHSMDFSSNLPPVNSTESKR